MNGLSIEVTVTYPGSAPRKILVEPDEAILIVGFNRDVVSSDTDPATGLMTAVVGWKKEEPAPVTFGALEGQTFGQSEQLP